MRNLKALGLAALMALAASAMFASAAQAQTLGTLTAGETPDIHEPVTIVGTQYGGLPADKTGWNFFAGTVGDEPGVTCDEALLTDTTATGTETKLTSVEADYIHCQAGGQPATVTMNGCNYLLTQPSTIAANEYTGKADLTCPKDKRIQVHVYLFGNSTNTSHSFNVCTIEVWPNAKAVGEHKTQELGGHVIYKNIFKEGQKHHVTAAVTATNITSFDGCETGEHHNNGEYKQTVTIKAFGDEPPKRPHTEQRELWISD